MLLMFKLSSQIIIIDAGWNAHTKSVALYYGRRRDAFIAACNKHLTGLAEWSVPSAGTLHYTTTHTVTFVQLVARCSLIGMFVWFKLPGIADSKSLIEKKAVDARVIMVFGQAFDPLDRASSYVRASFSLASDVCIYHSLRPLLLLFFVATVTPPHAAHVTCHMTPYHIIC
jgi:tryptophan aminotransferase